MSGREWKPGDVVRTRYGFGLVVEFNRIGCNPAHSQYSLHVHYRDGDWGTTIDARPLVVIDPEAIPVAKGGLTPTWLRNLAADLRCDPSTVSTSLENVLTFLADEIERQSRLAAERGPLTIEVPS